ncbi:MAG TPA: hypothetical protein VFO86_14800, partial [Terriglobia bacterium]|nr:hypothetical protein [Terriglobia bacterium]
MTFNPDDPKWTAYVLGELEDSERAEVESLLESSEDARAFVEELREATGALENELKELKVGFPPEIHAGLAASLTDAQRSAIHAAAAIEAAGGAANGSNKMLWFRQPKVHQALLGGLAVAATILLAIAIPALWNSQKSNGTANEPVQSAGAVKTEEPISVSPAVTSETAPKSEDTKEIASSKNSKLAQTEVREALTLSDASRQANEIRPKTPPSPPAP